MKFIKHCGIVCAALTSAASFAGPASYHLVPATSDDSGIRFDLGYTAGIHHGRAKVATGEIVADVSGLSVAAEPTIVIASAHFSAPISAMTSGDLKRDCHMREALGLDYKHSAYPAAHVCSANFEIPSKGNDAVVFPSIELDYKSLAGPVRRIDATHFEVQAVVTMNMHGLTKELPAPIALRVTLDPSKTSAFRVASDFSIKLADFDIIVKKFLMIGVSDRATVKVDFLAQEQ